MRTAEAKQHEGEVALVTYTDQIKRSGRFVTTMHQTMVGEVHVTEVGRVNAMLTIKGEARTLHVALGMVEAIEALPA